LHNKSSQFKQLTRIGNRLGGLLILVSFLTVKAIAGSPLGGYLASVGPMPLRFSQVLPPATNAIVLPKEEVLPAFLPTEEPSHVDAPAPAAVVTQVDSAPAPTAQITSSAPELAHPEDVVSPQMLIKYFKKSTNGVSTSVTAPIDFTPPKAPDNSGGSSAAYSNER
jgi:hypothetical protein